MVTGAATVARDDADHIVGMGHKARDEGAAFPPPTDINGTGNGLNNTITGANGNNALYGGDGNDTCGCVFGDYHENETERVSGGAKIDPSWYFRLPGGGPMYDVTSWSIHQLTSILGPARRVTAMSGVRVPTHDWEGRSVKTEADDNTLLLLDFGNALFAMVFGTAAGRSNPQFGASTFFGTKGVLDGVLLNDAPIDFDGYEKTADRPVSDWEAQMRTLPHAVGPHLSIVEAHVFEDVMQLVRWVREGVPSAATADHARHAIEIIEAGYRSAREGRAIDLVTSFDLPAD